LLISELATGGAFLHNDRMQLDLTTDLIARQPPEAQQIILALLAHIQVLQRRIAELEQRLPKTPQNSSVPPSTQHPHAKPPAGKARSKKKPGGQPGHAKQARPLVPTTQCDAIVPVKPATCRRCAGPLTGDDPTPWRHQVWELPVIRPLITEYQLHRLTCAGCGETTCAPLPAGVPVGQSGPRLVAFAALLMAYFRQSKRRTALFLQTLLQQPRCPALAVKLQQQATTALRPAYEELAAALPSQEHLGGDETPTKEGTAKAWLWTFVARCFTVFTIRPSRAATAVTELLTAAFTGVISCDRAKMYWQVGRVQWCWAHLQRDFRALAESPDGVVKRLGHDLLRQTRELFRLWARCRDGTIRRATFRRQMRPVRRRVESLLLRGQFSGRSPVVGMCRELRAHRDWLWTFVEQEGIEPTNNASERALRHAVIWRKLSFGTQSAEGSRFVETMLTVIETCRQQSRDVLEYVTAAVQSHFAGQPTPSLLPRV
jgi:transposase